MKSLADYLTERDQRLSPKGPELVRVAHTANCAPGTLYLIALGHRRPGPGLTSRIASATEGEVTRGALRPDVFGTSDQAA